MASQVLLSTNLTVEVSGWDDEKHFFVETSELEWGPTGSRTVLLRRPLHIGSMVFVRSRQSSGPHKGYPVAHRAEAIEPSCELGAFRVKLAESEPRRARLDASRVDAIDMDASRVDATIDPLEHLINVGERTKP